MHGVSTYVFAIFGIQQILAFSLPGANFAPSSLPSFGGGNEAAAPGTSFGGPPAIMPNPVSSFTDLGSNGGGDDGTNNGGDDGINNGGSPLPPISSLTLFRPNAAKEKETEEHVESSEDRFALLNETLSELEVDAAPITPCDCVTQLSDQETFDGLKKRFTGFQPSCGADPTMSSLQGSIDGLRESAGNIEQNSINLQSAQEMLKVAEGQLAEVQGKMEDHSTLSADDPNLESFELYFAEVKKSIETGVDGALCLDNCNSASGDSSESGFVVLEAEYDELAAGIAIFDVAEVEQSVTALQDMVSELSTDTSNWQMYLTDKTASLDTNIATKTDLSAQIIQLESGYSQRPKAADVQDISNNLENIRSEVSLHTMVDPTSEVASQLTDMLTQLSGYSSTEAAESLLSEVQIQYTRLTSMQNVDTSQVVVPSGAGDLATALAEIEVRDVKDVTSGLQIASTETAEILDSMNNRLTLANQIVNDIEDIQDEIVCSSPFYYLEAASMCIAITQKNLNWFDALMECKHQGGDRARLAVIDTEEKRAAIASHVYWMQSSNFLIGFHTMDVNTWRTTYTWVDRWDAIDQWDTKWNWGQPDRSYQTGCGNLWSGLWDDVGCFDFFTWSLCEIPMDF